MKADPREATLAGLNELLARKALVGVVLDIGAHTGLFAIAAGHCRAPVVIAFEPDPINYAQLVLSIYQEGLWGRVLPDYRAIGPTAGHGTVHRIGTNSGQNIVVADPNGGTQIISLDAALTATPDHGIYVKMDIEGGEWPIFDVLNEDLFRRKVQWLDIEQHKVADRDFETDLSAMLATMKKMGYEEIIPTRLFQRID